ncbi:protein kinase [Rhodococcus sp. ACPA1]|uniref:protein kinase domain-containing protein n=1 Tax=Rhodococcus sp. ACPA1 TaxID=2028572 RepID=UPI000BB0F8DE|nr:protein kinase [Rhodococcus sp. ACPA1]PBC58016.1 protein kinase [Rhodococcus sp. ACPA1]
MTDVDPFATQRDVAGSVAAELAAAGFADAREIGRGGFGVVYRCRQASLDRTVAVKVLTADLDEDNRARFLREQRAAGRLTGHPNVVNILQAGITAHDRPYIVMPFHARDSLETRIRHHGPLTLEDALRIGVKIAGALATAHGLGILHRDVKPANILFTDYGEPALTDFGIAHIAGGFQTTTGVVTGSPAFTAPEVIAGEPPTPAADVYGLGATLFAAITGHAAFERRSGEQLVAQFVRITSEPVPNPREHGIADDVSALIEGAMSTDPGRRPTIAELSRHLRSVQRTHGFPVADQAERADPESAMNGPSQADPPESAGGDRAQSDAPRVSHSGRTGALPLELTSFVDRRSESAEVKNLLASSRMVTLTGMGGVGKTRLALRVASQVRSGFADGVFLAELGELRDALLLVNVVADAVGVRDRSPRPLLEVLEDFLAHREVLLVLDNCEQVLDAVAELAESLLRTSPRLRMLMTSREPIGISGEVALPIPPLAVPDPDQLAQRRPRNDAVTLFAERGAAVDPGFAVTEDNNVVVARICHRLDGLPLAIELAAARLRAIPPEEILQRLTDRYALLTRGNRDAPSRQQTLRMCIDWSYDLCTPREQHMWSALSIFAGSFELNAAEEVWGGDQPADDLLDTVTSLIDKSILIREHAGPIARFRMLDTVRDYGRDKARDSSTYPELRRRYRDWYEQLARDAEADWIGPRQLTWITRLAAEQSNLRQALEFCITDDHESGIRMVGALFQFWLARGLFSEGRRWIARLLACNPEPGDLDRAKALYAATVMAGLQGDLRAAATLIQEGRALANQSREPMLQAHIDLADGYRALFSGELDNARGLFDHAADVYAEHNNELFEVVTIGVLGLTHELLDDTERAIECYERGLAIAEVRGETVYRSYTLWALAVAVWRHGDGTRANQLLRQALDVGRNINDRLNASMCLQALAWIAAEEQNPERAVVLSAAAQQLSQSVGSPIVFIPALRDYQDKCERETRNVLSEQKFTAAYRKGSALGVAAAVAYALGEQAPEPSPQDAPSSAAPTKRELEVAELVAEGLTNREIATRLTISPRTAQGHVEHLLAKLGFTSRAQIAAWVMATRHEGH